MIRYVPSYILNAHEHKIYRGSFSGYVLFFDIADFTNLSNVYRNKGKQGAEALNQFLEAVLSHPIRQVESRGGFISHFAGDAFCAVFSEADAAAVKQAVDAIQEHFARYNYVYTDIGESPVKVRMTICSGTIYWRIFRNDMQCEYVFYGKPFEQMKELAHRKEDVAMSPEVEQAFAQTGISHTAEKHLSFPFSAETTDAYVHPRLRGEEPENEIRDAAYCFVDLSDIADANQEAVLSLVHAKLDDYSGFLNKLDASDKGLVALIIFGLPKAIGNTLERTCSFALEIVTEVPQLRFGIACGNAYAGFVGSDVTREYTALGAVVNLASRLMLKANAGEILTDSYLQQEMQYKCSFAPAEVFPLKGFASAVHSNRLLDRLPKPLQRFHSDFMGRAAEIKNLRQAVNQSSGEIIYVSGEPGMGKSRLIIETLKSYPKHYFMFCDPSGHRILEPIKQFLNQYFGTNPLMSKERNMDQFRRQWEGLAGEDRELNRIESIIASILGYEWENSIWSILPPEERPEQQKNAFATFVNRISSKAKLIIHLDDPQWIDSSSQAFLQNLGARNIDNICIIAACRYHDDGTPVDLEIPNWKATHVDLKPLISESATSMIKHIMKTDSLPQESLAWIISKADGNPLFLEQVVAYLKENDCFDAEHHLIGNLEYLSSFGIADIIGSRIDSLTEHVRNTLQHACVLGLEFNTHVLSEMLSRRLDQDMDEGKQARVWADLDELRYIFTHVLIKDTAYNRMLSEKLKNIHILAAEAMERLYRDEEKLLNEHAEEIANHFHKAGLEEKAAIYYDMAGYWLKSKYDFVKSELNLTKSLQIKEKVLGFEHPEIAKSLHYLADLYVEHGKYNSSELMYKRVISIRDKLLGEEHPDTLSSYNNLASVYINQNRFVEAFEMCHKVLQIREKVMGTEHLDTASSLNTLGILFTYQGKYSEAESLFKRALQIKERVFGPTHLDTAAQLNSLGALYWYRGMYSEAESLVKRSLVIREQVLGPLHPDTATAMNNIAVLYDTQCRYTEAVDMQLRSLQIREKVLGSDHPDTATSLDNLALSYKRQGKYTDAEPLYLRAYLIRESTLGPEHNDTAASMNNLAALYKRQGKYSEAECLYVKSLSVFEKSLGRDHPETARLLNNLASLYELQCKYSDAESLFLQAIKIWEKTLGKDHPDTARAMDNLAGIYRNQNRYADAEVLCLKALQIFEKSMGKDNPETALSLNNLGNIHVLQEKSDLAEPLYLRALEIRNEKLGLDHPDTQQSIKSLVSLYEKLNQPEKADAYRAMLKEPDLA